MKKLLLILAVGVSFTACKKTTERVIPELPDESFLMPTRAQYEKDKAAELATKANPGKGGGKPKPTPTPTEPPVTTPPAGAKVIYCNFTGAWIRNDERGRDWVWQHATAADFYCAPSILSQAEKDVVMADAQRSYGPYDVFITDDSTVYQSATGWKQELVITQTKWLYGGSGFCFLGSGSFSYHPVAFVFETDLFNYDAYIGKIVTHEAGHAVGMRHQSTYNPDCTLYSHYAQDVKMGTNWSTEGIWRFGTTTSCTTYEDNFAQLRQVLGLR